MPHIRALETLFDDLPVGVTLVDADGRIVISNRASGTILGIPAETLTGLDATGPSWGVCGPDGEPLPPDQIPTLLALRERRRVTVPQVGVRNAQGMRTWLHLTADPLPDGGALVIYQDITPWCELAASNLRMESLLRTALDLGRMGYFIHQPGQRAWAEDPSLTRLLGSEPEVLTRFCEAVEGQADPASFAFEFQAPARDGESDRWFACRGEAVSLPTGGPPIRVGILQDITRQRRDSTVARVQAITQAKARMAGYLAHEVNNPLAGLKNATLLIRRSLGDPAKLEHYLKLMDQGVARIQEVIRALTELNRELGPGEPVPITEVVQNLAALTARALEAGRIRLVRELDPSLRLPEAEAEVVRQVLFNLLMNAIEASPPDSTLRLEGRNREGLVELTLTDAGPGIPEDLRGAIWSVGFSTKRPTITGGLTPGLALGRGLLRDLGGDLVLLPSQPGCGASFSIRLPLPPMDSC